MIISEITLIDLKASTKNGDIYYRPRFLQFYFFSPLELGSSVMNGRAYSLAFCFCHGDPTVVTETKRKLQREICILMRPEHLMFVVSPMRSRKNSANL